MCRNKKYHIDFRESYLPKFDIDIFPFFMYS